MVGQSERLPMMMATGGLSLMRSSPEKRANYRRRAGAGNGYRAGGDPRDAIADLLLGRQQVARGHLLGIQLRLAEVGANGGRVTEFEELVAGDGVGRPRLAGGADRAAGSCEADPAGMGEGRLGAFAGGGQSRTAG